MADAVRTFVIKTILQGDAARQLEAITKQARDIASQGVKVVTSFDTDKVVKNVTNFRNSLKNASEDAKNSTNSINRLFGAISAGSLATMAGIGGLVAFSAAAITLSESIHLDIAAIEGLAGAQASLAAQQAILASGTRPGGLMSRTAQMETYMTATGFRNTPEEMSQIIKSTETVRNSKWRAAFEAVGITSNQQILEALTTKQAETSPVGNLIKQLSPTFFKSQTLQSEIVKVRSEEAFAYTSTGLVEQEARRRIGVRALGEISGGKGMEDVRPALTKGIEDIQQNFEMLSKSIGDTIEPAVLILMNFINTIMKMATAAPQVTILVISLIALAGAMGIASLVGPLLIGAIGALLSPIGLAAVAIVILIGILGALESRTHLVTAAWEKFSKSEIGKDLINGVKSLLDYLGLIGGGDFFDYLIKQGEALSKFIGSIFDQIDAIYKMAKGGDIMGALKGGMELALKLSLMGIAAAMIEGQLPLKRVQDDALDVLKRLKLLWDSFVRWLSDIWGSITNLLQPILDMGKALTDFVEWAKNKLGLGQGGTPLSENYTSADITRLLKEGKTPEDIAAILYPGNKPAQQNVIQSIKTGEYLNQEVIRGTGSPRAATGYAEGLVNLTTNQIGQPVPGMPGVNFAGVPTKEQSEAWSRGETIEIEKHAAGGEVTKSGLGWVDQGEPIVPAEVARSSTLIDRLREIASGPSGGISSGGVKIENININLEGPQDARSISEEIKDYLERYLSDFEFGGRTEGFVHRANRAYKGI